MQVERLVFLFFFYFFFFLKKALKLLVLAQTNYLLILCCHKQLDNLIVEVKFVTHQVLHLGRLVFPFLNQSPKHKQNYSEVFSFHSTTNWFSAVIYTHSYFYALFTEILLSATLAYPVRHH